jgi:hypothetical protein
LKTIVTGKKIWHHSKLNRELENSLDASSEDEIENDQIQAEDL